MQTKIGPLIVDLQGIEINPEEAEILQHPLVGGVVLFARNYLDYQQLESLCTAIRQQKKDLLIMVDQEGGRVQRFKQDFTRLPPLDTLGMLYKKNQQQACFAAKECGWLMAHELLAAGVTNSLAPVLDLYHQENSAIGDRAFSDDIDALITLSKFYRKGMNEAGMRPVGKHFPGHGNVIIDSHIAIPHDSRTLQELEASDLKPFLAGVESGLMAIMSSHIIFDKVDARPTTYSSVWLHDLLRNKYKFRGVILSDDIHMEGANISESYEQRFQMARQAGCDFVLLCNYRPGVIEILGNSYLDSHLISEKKWQYLQPTHQLISSNDHERHIKAKNLIRDLEAI